MHGETHGRPIISSVMKQPFRHLVGAGREAGANKAGLLTSAAIEDVNVACRCSQHDQVLVHLVEAATGDWGIAPARRWPAVTQPAR